jgi:hypothetical protein
MKEKMMKKSKILEEAKILVDVDSYKFICIAITNVSIRKRYFDIDENYDTLTQNVKELHHWIEKLLNEYVDDELLWFNCLENWLNEYHTEFVQSQENMKKLRIRWLDWMIVYWQEKGE